MQIFAKSDCGKVRQINQDAFAVEILPAGSALAVVCDGMGGASAGDIASKTAVDIITHYILNAYSVDMDDESLISLMKNAVISANIDIYDLAAKDESLKGMGTTAVVAVIHKGNVYICNIGDSRAYLVRESLIQITRDHSIVQTLLEDGKLTPEEARVHPKKNVITRALGVEETVLPDTYSVPIEENDIILLCTDGLSGYVDSDVIFNIVRNNELNKVTDLLIDISNSAGGKDNITAVVASCVQKG